MEQVSLVFKVVILGDSGVGKTSILQRFNLNTFDYAMDTTIGASFMTKIIKVQNDEITLNVWDTAGQERYKSLVATYARGANAAIICFDLTNMATLTSIDKWTNELYKFCSQDLPVYLVGNKADLDKAISTEEILQWATKLNCVYTECSAQTGAGVRALFEKIANDLYSNRHQRANSETKDFVVITDEKENKKKCC